VLGQFIGTLTHLQLSSAQTIFVVRGLKTNLLGLPAITSLQLLHRVDATCAEEPAVPSQFKNISRAWEHWGINIRIHHKVERGCNAACPGMCPSPSMAKSEKNRIEWRLQG